MTNSSSSSFILIFEDKNKIDEDIRKQNSQFADKYLDIIINDVNKAIKEGKTLTLDDVRDMIRRDHRWNHEDKLENIWRMYRRIFMKNEDTFTSDWLKYKDEHEKEIEKDIDRMIESEANYIYNEYIVKNHPDTAVIVELRYADEDGAIGGIMEHNVMPYIEQVSKIFSHH